MKWVVRCITLAALALIGVLVWITFFPSPERAIKARMVELQKTASFAANEGSLAKLSNATKLASFFTTDAQVIVDLAGHSRQELNGRDEILRACVGVRNHLQSLDVKLLDVKVNLGPDKKTARVNLTAKASTSGEPDFMIQELECLVTKTDGDWLIRRVATVRTLD